MSSADYTDQQIAAHDGQRDLGPAAYGGTVALLRTQFSPGATVLDAGGGSGTAVPALLGAELRVILVDISRAMLAAASSRGVPRIRADLCALPLYRASVDGAYAAFVLQNIPRWRTAVHELTRVVRPQGAVVVAWGNNSPDRVADAVRRRLLSELENAGAAVGVAANASGLADLEAGHAAFCTDGFGAVEEYVIAGCQGSSIRRLAAIRAANPFMSRASAQQREQALNATLQWAEREFGRIDEQRTMAVELRLHTYRRR